jgi:hypothetical protein
MIGDQISALAGRIAQAVTFVGQVVGAPAERATEIGAALVGAIILVAFILIVMWRCRFFVYPWVGIGDEVETFERVKSFLPLAVPVFALGVLVTFLCWRLAPESKSSSHSVPLAEQGSTAGGHANAHPLTEIDATKVADTVARSIDRVATQLAEVRTRSDPSSQLADIGMELRGIAERLPPAPSELDVAVRDVAAALRGMRAVAPPGDAAALSMLDNRLRTVEQRLHDLESAARVEPAVYYLSLMEALIWEIVRPQDIHCEALAQFGPLDGGPTREETVLLAAARQRGFTAAQKYRTISRQVFFDAAHPEPSPIGWRVLRLTVDQARAHGFALSVRANADTESDGSTAAAVARERAATIARFIAANGMVPVVGFATSAGPGTTSEPYRRLVQVDMLEPCK